MTKQEIEHFTTPFTHTTVQSFLNPNELKMLQESYDMLTFNYKKTDLFSFYQTSALNIEFLEKSIIKFLNKNQKTYNFTLNQSEKGQPSQINVTFDIFASYYTNGSYLLPHDDSIDNRRIAFCLYLNTYETGELIMYNEECDKEIKRIKVQENLFVLFGVEKAYHEVNYCSEDGRRAVTGWLNWSGDVKGKDVLQKCFSLYTKKDHTSDDNIKNVKDYSHLAYNNNYDTSEEQTLKQQKVQSDNEKHNTSNKLTIELLEDIKVMPDCEIRLDKKFLSEEGPFYSRKIGRIVGSQTIIDLKGYKLVKKDGYKLRLGDYILLNDKINTVASDVVDLYFFEKIESDDFSVVKYVNENGEIDMEVDCLDNHLFVIKRLNREIYIERMENEVFMEHYVYERIK